MKEQNENLFLWGAKAISWLIGMPIVPNVEYVIYRCRLEIAEADRIKANIQTIKPITVAIEDKEFHHHCGINFRGVGRALLNRIRHGTKAGGGSSITQQFVRSNFIASLSPAWKRKIMEVPLSFWVESIFSKEEILRGYLTTARFDDKIFGFHRASRHFFTKAPKDITKAHSFILIERLSNIKGLFRGNRVQATLGRLLSEGILTLDDVYEAIKIYRNLLSKNLIRQEGETTPDKIENHFKTLSQTSFRQ